tara:strand:+ start:240 stop:1121 length:882 start_codon:yes stop_codon:yes gene_type:complete
MSMIAKAIGSKAAKKLVKKTKPAKMKADKIKKIGKPKKLSELEELEAKRGWAMTDKKRAKIEKRIAEIKKSDKMKKESAEANKKEQAKLNKKDKKEGSPKMAAEKKAQGLSAGAKRKLKSKDTKTIKKLEKAARSLGKDYKGNINRLMSEKQLGNFKGKQQMHLAGGSARGADAAKETMMRLYNKMKSGKYSQTDYNDFISAQRKVRDFMGRRGDVDLKAPKNVLLAKFPEPNLIKAKRLEMIKEVGKKFKAKKAKEGKAQGGMPRKRTGHMDYRHGGMIIVSLDLKKKKKGK